MAGVRYWSLSVRNAAADGERRRIATSTALATALQHGALGPILVVVKTLLQAAQSQSIGDPSKNSTFSIDSGQHLDYLCQLNASDAIPLVHLKEYGQVKQAGDRQQILADTKRFHFAVDNAATYKAKIALKIVLLQKHALFFKTSYNFAKNDLRMIK